MGCCLLKTDPSATLVGLEKAFENHVDGLKYYKEKVKNK